VLELFERDPNTSGIILVGEIGGSDEAAAAAYVRNFVTKAVVAYIAGVTAPPGKRMGHAGAIVAGGKGTAAEQYQALQASGVRTVKSPALLGETMRELLQRSRAARPAPIERRTKPVSAGKKSPARKKSRAPQKRPPTMPRRKQRQRP
jgi:succinyl-CoA synthetase alpha subunit